MVLQWGVADGGEAHQEEECNATGEESEDMGTVFVGADGDVEAVEGPVGEAAEGADSATEEHGPELPRVLGRLVQPVEIRIQEVSGGEGEGKEAGRGEDAEDVDEIGGAEGFSVSLELGEREDGA